MTSQSLGLRFSFWSPLVATHWWQTQPLRHPIEFWLILSGWCPWKTMQGLLQEFSACMEANTRCTGFHSQTFLDGRHFRRVTKAERIFAESMREKESQVQEERWTGLGLQGWLRGNMKNVWVWLAIVVFFLRGGGSWACSSVVESLHCLHTSWVPSLRTKDQNKQETVTFWSLSC